MPALLLQMRVATVFPNPQGNYRAAEAYHQIHRKAGCPPSGMLRDHPAPRHKPLSSLSPVSRVEQSALLEQRSAWAESIGRSRFERNQAWIEARPVAAQQASAESGSTSLPS